MTFGTALLAIAVVAFSIAVLRARSFRAGRAAAAAAAARPADARGVLVGAAPIRLDAALGRGVMILHGFNDTPQSVAELAHALHSRGWSVTVPLLPAHGRADDLLDRSGSADAWVAHARGEWDALRARLPRSVLCGQSMGGALAVILASETPPAALVLLAPYLSMGRTVRFWSTVWPLWQLAMPQLVANPRRGYRDESARDLSLGRGRFAPRLVAQLKRVVDRAHRALPLVQSPTLVLHAVSDYRIPSASAKATFERLGVKQKTLLWRQDAGHVLAADRGRDEVFAIVCDWLDTTVRPA